MVLDLKKTFTTNKLKNLSPREKSKKLGLKANALFASP